MKFPTGAASMASPRPFLPVFLLFLGTLAMLYQLMPHIASSVGSRLHLPHLTSSCTKDVGEGLCCELFLSAEPCIEQCREKYLDRETFTLTNEYDECSDKCLIAYKGSCVGREGEKRRGLVGEGLDEIEKREAKGDLFVEEDDFAVEGGAGVEGPNVPEP